MNESATVSFDTSLPTLASIIRQYLGDDILGQVLIVRDTTGRLFVVCPIPPPPPDKLTLLEAAIIDRLGPYVHVDDLITFANDPVSRSLFYDPTAFRVEIESVSVRFLDRRIVGSAWIDCPGPDHPTPPRIVFASLKGGVGRSTALAVTAADLARRNKNILVLDLDLEAPGIGDMLLDSSRMPRFGAIDYLVEDGLGGIPDRTLEHFIGTSTLTSPTGGRVDVIPALGSLSFTSPANILAKLSRAMIEDIDGNGAILSVPAQFAAMVARLSQLRAYDAVLIDSRAGMSELAAPAILGLGADVLFFGTAQPQTLRGYSALFAALRLLAQRDLDNGRRADWRLRFKAVQAKAPLDSNTTARYRDDLYDIFAENLYDAEQDQPDSSDPISFGIDDPSAPHWPLVIPFNQLFLDFDPTRAPNQLTADFYEHTFRPFLNHIDSILAPQTEEPRQ